MMVGTMTNSAARSKIRQARKWASITLVLGGAATLFSALVHDAYGYTAMLWTVTVFAGLYITAFALYRSSIDWELVLARRGADPGKMIAHMREVD